jgi:hypothetical protein
MDSTFEDVVKLAEQLDPTERNRLIYRLRLMQMAQPQVSETPQPVPNPSSPDAWFLKRGSEYVEYYRSPTREELLQDAAALRDTTARHEDRLLGKYANSHLPEMSEEDFHAQMHSIATEWETELDEFSSDEP